MFTVLLKEWVNLGQSGPERGSYAETLYYAERVDFHPPGRLIEGVGVLTLEFTRGVAGITIEMDANRTAYVMNGTGKTVATYYGTLPPHLVVAKEFA